jgi:hypothetical protein
MRRPFRQGHIASGVGAVAKGDANRVSEKWHKALRFLDRQLGSEPPINNERHAVFIRHVSLKKRNPPAINDHIVVLEGTREVDAKAFV